MSAPAQASIRNRLLSVMSADSFARLQPNLETVDLPVKTVLVEADEPASHVHFLEAGLGSIVAASVDEEPQQIEVGHVGWEGMAGVHVVHDVDHTPNRTFMQVAGSALRMPVLLFAEAMDDDVALRKLMLRYAHTYEIQLAHSALANGRYSMNERLARWLLMCHDRLDGDDLGLTHEFLSLMLGVRRSGVTNEVHILEGVGIIKASRGRIRVLDRDRLEDVAGGSYGVPEREYERLVGRPSKAS